MANRGLTLELREQVVVVTGANGAMGSALVKLLQGRARHVVGTLRGATVDWRPVDETLSYVTGNLTDRTAVNFVVAEILRHQGSCQAWVNVAGGFAMDGPVEEISPVVLREQLAKLTRRSRHYRTKLRFSPNFITPEEIVRYYSNESSYKDYRCYIPWSKMAFTAYGDVFSCPHVRLGNFLEADSGSLPWVSKKAKAFRKLLKKEKIFPGCLGCCQSEYIGPNGAKPELVKINSADEILKKARGENFLTQPNCNG
ncbi:MAG: NAD-dependent epimerase/dehydratase family protein [Nitrospinae bacterium]|nr:NAD-dependent epimerase/dehydratase family protein [Nitrospinota bacterium]